MKKNTDSFLPALRLMHLSVLFLWQLPQQVGGMLVLLLMKYRRAITGIQRNGPVFMIETRNIGLSLGWFIFWTPNANRYSHLKNDCLMHELGHARQSVMLGPFYLLLVGIPSLMRSAYARYYFKKHRRSWAKYYDAYPENWADRLGSVK